MEAALMLPGLLLWIALLVVLIAFVAACMAAGGD